MTDTDMPWHWWLVGLGLPAIIVVCATVLAFMCIRRAWLACLVVATIMLIVASLAAWQIPSMERQWDRDERRQARLNECVWGGGVPIYRYRYRGSRTYVRCAAPFIPEERP